jgi:hypothetical protein
LSILLWGMLFPFLRLTLSCSFRMVMWPGSGGWESAIGIWQGCLRRERLVFCLEYKASAIGGLFLSLFWRHHLTSYRELLLFFSVKPRASHMLDKHSTTEQCPQPQTNTEGSRVKK